MNTSAHRRARTVGLTALAALALTVPLGVTAAAAAPADPPVTNLAHLDFLLDAATPPADVDGHSTYRQAEEPALVMPWTYADARDGGTFERVGGGPLDPETGYWGQGAYNADDITRAAVVYIRHWELTGDDDSRDTAYELLRSVAYFQTTDGPDAGNVVLWMQPDGTFNPSPEPVELPDPSDSGPSYWLARTLWALGEGYAAFKDEDPAFAAFLDDRFDLSLGALNRQVLSRYGTWTVSDGKRVPAWLITNGADASAEAVLGLAARVAASPDRASATALRQLAKGIAAMSDGSTREWPYRAVLPWAESPAIWHAWGSQMPAALAAASIVLKDRALARPAVADATSFTTTLLTAGGPDNGWNPSPVDRVQIAYGADSRVQSLLGVADATGSEGFEDLAAMQAAWFFGANHAGQRMYDPATGVTYDGLQPDGTVNRNSGAESTIHGLLTALALDAHPDVRRQALSLTEVGDREGLTWVEAEDAARTTGEISTPESWTGESSWSGDKLTLSRGETAVFDVGTAGTDRWIEPVVWSEVGERTSSTWTSDRARLGSLQLTGPRQGISPTPGAMHPHTLQKALPGSRDELRVVSTRGEVQVDGILVRPFVSRLVLEGDDGARTELVHSAARSPQKVRVGAGDLAVYDDRGREVRAKKDRTGVLTLPAGGFAIVER
ncbi:hypothetical protein [Microbacterium sp. 77mftsu3.1]|uniref:hypothetical protein n=1 Tax=Microbacterium sp. 77mftsu3.1 TaxID=1761802 RepID=UPI000371CD69|nr:hypothetical protein [Microbacterium sp. 77mftsu3.1]SDH21513.1 hypothetical protein SAMN04488590_2890 [Microbacterium sp. 77mftsu3.1]